jgi:hypothetical protein
MRSVPPRRGVCCGAVGVARVGDEADGDVGDGGAPRVPVVDVQAAASAKVMTAASADGCRWRRW